MNRLLNKSPQNNIGKTGRIFLFPIFAVFILISFTQCKEPLGWTAYGQHIEFINDPIVAPLSGGTFSLIDATAQLTIGGGEIPSSQIFHFIGPHGATPPGNLYGTDTEVKAKWLSLGFKEITVTSVVYAYLGLGFSETVNPILDVYGVANTEYTIFGGDTIAPWRMSDVAVIDLTPSLALTINNILEGTSSLTVELDGISYDFSRDSSATGTSQVVTITGISPSLNSTNPSLKVEAYITGIPVAVAEYSATTLSTIGMGSNTDSVPLASSTQNIVVSIVEDLSSVLAPYSYSYSIPISSGATSGTTDATGAFNTNISMNDINETATISVTLDGASYIREVPVIDLVRETFNNGYYELNIQTTSVGAPTLSLNNFSAPENITLDIDSPSGADKLRMYCNGTPIFTVSAPQAAWGTSGIEPDVEYQYQMAAIDSNGIEGPRSNIVTVKVCKVSYDSNGGTIAPGFSLPSDQYCLVGESITVPATVASARISSTLNTNTWNPNPDGTGTVLLSGTVQEINSSMTLYFDWTLDTVINFHLYSLGETTGAIYKWDTIDESVCDFYTIQGISTNIANIWISNYCPANTGEILSYGQVPGDFYSYRIQWRDHTGRSSEWVTLPAILF